jgi:hypothetical protein
MALEKLIVCLCRHTLDLHDNRGCNAGIGGALGCPCALRPLEVVDRVITVELEVTRRRWLGATPSARQS